MTTALGAVIGLNAAVALLGSQAAGRFQVIGYQRQKKPAETLFNLPLVQCWIANDDVNWDRVSATAPNIKEVRITVQFTVSQPAKADLLTLEDPSSTDNQRAAALVNLTTPAFETTKVLYEAYAAVSEILNDARNYRLGLTAKIIQEKEYDNFQQDEFPSRGGPGILTATSTLSFRVDQAQLGDLGNQPASVVSDADLSGVSTDQAEEDTVSKAGVNVNA